MKKLPLEDVWGIGKEYYQRIGRDLNRYSGLTAYDFATMYRKRVRKILGVVGERTYMELNGIQCFDFEFSPKVKERIMTSRMLTTPLTEYDEVLAALIHHLETSARKLRDQTSYARKLFVFFTTSTHPNYKKPKLTRTLDLRFPSPLRTTAEMIPYLTMMLKSMWPMYRNGQEKYRFNKCGVMLGEITPDNAKQPHFTEDLERSRKMEVLQEAIDEINGESPADKRTVLFGGEYAHKDKVKFIREGLTENPAALWKQRHKISNT